MKNLNQFGKVKIALMIWGFVGIVAIFAAQTRGQISPPQVYNGSKVIGVIQVTPFATATFTPNTLTPTNTPTNTPTFVYQTDEAQTIITNLAALSTPQVLTFNHVAKGCNLAVYIGAPGTYPFLATATPNVYVIPQDPLSAGMTAIMSTNAWKANGNGLGAFFIPNVQAASGSASFGYAQSYAVSFSSNLGLATYTPTAVPVTIIGNRAP
jgi:hypothetical protein